MDFRLDDDQVAIQDNLRQFCAARYPLDDLSQRDGGLDRGAWDALIELGVLSLMPDEERGGLGMGVVGATIAFEQIGEHLVPGPLLWSSLAALSIDDVASGTLIAGGTIAGGTIAGGAIAGGAAAAEGPYFVEYGSDVDLIVALRPDGMFRIDRDDLPPATELDALDPLNAVSSFATLPTGARIGSAEEAFRLGEVATVLCAAMQVGVAQAALDVAVAYSTEREQFGVPIGSFQALKHMMADMYVRVGLARSATYAAAAALDDPVPDAVDAWPGPDSIDTDISAAKLLAGEAALDNAKASVQVLGGMGFTWEMAPNFLLKRAWVLEHAFGTTSRHALSIAAHLERELEPEAAS